MGAVVGSVAIAEAGTPAPPPALPGRSEAPPRDPNAPTMSFADDAPTGDRAASILDEVLAGDEQGASEADGAHTADPAGSTPAPATEQAKPEPAPEAPVNDVEAARLRKGFAKLANEQQKLHELQNAARAERAAAQQYATKAQKHDEIVSKLENDPAGYLFAHGGEPLVQKALQGFIDMEKSPADREVAKIRQELAERDKAQAQRAQEESVSRWRNDVIAKVRSDERFDIVNALGLQPKVIDVIAGYYEKHSTRNEKGDVIVPAILPWDQAAQAVEDAHATAIESSKRYGKRAPAAAPATETKPTPSAKPAPAKAKTAPTSLSSVPVAETPSHGEDDLPSDDLDARQAALLAQLGF